MNMLDPTAIANPHDYTKEDIKGLCVRRFKSDINDQLISSFQEREVNIEKVMHQMLKREYMITSQT